MKRIIMLSILSATLTACSMLNGTQKSLDMTKCIPLLQLEPAVQQAIVSCVQQ